MVRLEARLRERGAAAVEFALVVPILIALVLGIADFGRAYLMQSTLSMAAREGARYGAIHDEAANAQVVEAANNAAVALGVSGTSAVATNTCASPTDNVSVTVKFSDFDFFLPIPNIDITATGVMRCGG